MAAASRRRRPRAGAGRILRRALIRTLSLLVLLSVVLVASLRWVAPPTSAFMLRDHWRGGPVHYEWVDRARISDHVAIAVLASEDQRFPQHWGFDLDAIGDAISERLERGRVRGASTISQQVAKNLFLWPQRSFWRKGLEAYFTVLIELLWSKQRILEVYLNIAQFGDRVYGVGAASGIFFARPAARLGPYQGALLAAVLPNPLELRLRQPSEYVQRRAGEIRKQVRQLGGVGYLAGL